MHFRAFLNKFLSIPLWSVLIFVFFSAVALTYIFVNQFSETWFAYPIYVFSFYTVCVLSYRCVHDLPHLYKSCKNRLYANSIGKRYFTDAAFRNNVSLTMSLIFNLMYAALNILLWYLHRSAWFLVLAMYYTILALMRYLLAHYSTRDKYNDRIKELRLSRMCAVILLTLNFVLTGAVLMILYASKGFDYPGILIYVMALYSFYSTSHAIISLVKYRKYHSPVLTFSKIISLCSALVSMLALETAMFAQFGADMSRESQWLMIALTGAGVSFAVIGLSIFMIIKTGKEIKEIKKFER